jgi:high-affinity K+ transport system ATPase subunit B
MRLLILAIALLLPACANSTSDDVVESGAGIHKDDLARAQKIDRRARIYLGASLTPAELRKLVSKQPQAVTDALVKKQDFALRFKARIAAYARVDESKVTGSPDTPLADVLKNLVTDDKSCGGTVAECATEWLIAEVAPTVGKSWVKERRAQLAKSSYRKILDALALEVS